MKTIVTFTNLLTAKQVIHVYGFTGMTKEKLPRKNKPVELFPIGRVFYRFTKTNQNATYGGKLFRVEHCQQFPDEVQS